MATGFNDPIKREQKPRSKPVDGNNTPWNFSCPSYDQRSSYFVNAGTKYGVGHKNPVGNKGAPVQRAKTLPYGKVDTLRVDEKA